MTAKEMQIRYWENEKKDAERRIELYEEGSSLWVASQYRYQYAQRMLDRIEERGNDVCIS